MLLNRMFYLFIVIFLIVTACTPESAQEVFPPTSIPATSADIPSAPTSIAALAVTSTLDGLTTLPHRIQWEAKPSVPENQITQVDFLIDGQLAFVEQHVPYMYGRDDNYLVTSFLTPGEHNFTVRVNTVGGQSVESTVKATVDISPAPPQELNSTSWTRDMTDSDLQKATSSELPPLGQWGLTINSMGWSLLDPLGGGINIDLAYQSTGQVELRPTIEVPPFPNDRNGAFCHEPDPPFLWSYAISNDGKTLTLHPVGNDPCGDRIAILEGTWTREGN